MATLSPECEHHRDCGVQPQLCQPFYHLSSESVGNFCGMVIKLGTRSQNNGTGLTLTSCTLLNLCQLPLKSDQLITPLKCLTASSLPLSFYLSLFNNLMQQIVPGTQALVLLISQIVYSATRQQHNHCLLISTCSITAASWTSSRHKQLGKFHVQMLLTV